MSTGSERETLRERMAMAITAPYLAARLLDDVTGQRAAVLGYAAADAVLALLAASSPGEHEEPREGGDAWVEVAARLDDAWNAVGDYEEDDVDVLRALCGEALMVVRDLYQQAIRAPEDERAATMEKALRPFADAADTLEAQYGDHIKPMTGCGVYFAWLDAARSALSPTESRGAP